MAFDFNGNKRPTPTSGDPVRKDIDYTSPKYDPEGFGSLPPRNSGGFGNRPSGFQDPPSAPSGFQNKPSGFQNRPELRDGPRTDTGIRPGIRNTSTRSVPKAPAKRPAARSNGGSSIPWKILLPIIGILLAVILIIVFHEAITEFLIQLLAWAILILIVLFLFKRLIFGGKKKN